MLKAMSITPLDVNIDSIIGGIRHGGEPKLETSPTPIHPYLKHVNDWEGNAIIGIHNSMGDISVLDYRGHFSFDITEKMGCTVFW